MEMCYDGTLVMPSSYAVMDEEEMSYVEGGNGWWNSVGFIGGVIDVAIAAFTAGQAIYGVYAIKKFIKNNKHYMLRAVAPQLTSMFGSVAGHMLGCALDIVMIVGGTSIGSIIANAIDYVDGNRSNGYVFG